MYTASATVTTISGARYLNRLCKHWSHKFKVTTTDSTGEVLFDPDRLLLVANAENLILTLECVEQSNLLRFEPVVAEHLQRMANSEPLTIEWTRA
jgi:hypothetical protein